MKTFFSAAVLSLALATGASAAVVNAGFDDLTGSNPGTGLSNGNTLANMVGATGSRSWDIYSSLNGWTTTTGPGLEVQTKNTVGAIDPHSGPFYIELDGDPDMVGAAPIPGGGNSTITQSIFLEKGKYELSFFYAPRVRNNGELTNGVEYSIGDVLDSITGPNADAPFGQWTEVVALFSVAQAGNFDLTFSAIGRNDTLGGFIDTVSIAAVPLPAPVLMLGFGLAGLFAASRRKTA